MSELVCVMARSWIINRLHIHKNSSDKPFVIGIGSGRTIVPFIKLLTEYIAEMEPKFNIVCIPTSEQSKFLLLEHFKSSDFMKLGTLDEYPEVHITVDGLDFIDFPGKFLIKGGGAAHCMEKMVAEASKEYIVVVSDESKFKKTRDEYFVPVEVLPFASETVKRRLMAEFDYNLLSCSIRQCPSGSGKVGPIITDNGNLILDLKFSIALYSNPSNLDQRIRKYAGVVETGIFWRLPQWNILIYYVESIEGVNEKEYMFR